MAEELSVPNFSSNNLLEIAVLQPDHPNQAVFIASLDLSLQEFRNKLADSELVLPGEWVFMTRAGSLISNDQEENILLDSITREREDASAHDVMISPALSYRTPPRRAPNPGGSPLASFATIVGALRDVYVTSIQPNFNEVTRPLILGGVAALILSFIAAFALTLAVAVSVMGGMNRSLLVPFLRSHLCAEEIEIASHEIPKLEKQIYELGSRMSNMRQVEVGTLVCKEDNHMYEEMETTLVHVPFRKTAFTETPRVIFSVRGVSVDDFNSVKLENLKVNNTGFAVRCSYFGKWMHYHLEYSWLAVGK